MTNPAQTNADLQTEIEKWQKAVEDSRTTINWLERRGDKKNQRIRQLEQQVQDLGGTPIA